MSWEAVDNWFGPNVACLRGSMLLGRIRQVRLEYRADTRAASLAQTAPFEPRARGDVASTMD